MNPTQEAVLTKEADAAAQRAEGEVMPARILVVDDESDLEILFRQMFRREIRKKELSFVFVHNGRQALDRLEEDDAFDMVLSDIRMPQMDGLTLLSRLNKKYPILKAVMVTAYGDMENIRKAMNGGAFDFISKPIQYQDLKTTIQKTLAHVRELKELKRAREERERAQARLVAELRKLDQMKDEFLANTSHELRTPLNGIIGIVEALMGGTAGDMSDRAMQNLDLVLQSGRRLANLVNDILDFAKLKKENLVLNHEFLQLRPLVDMAFRIALPMASGKGIDLENNIAENLPRIYGDPDRIQQILVNLVGNAVKFTQEGGVKARAELEGDYLRVSIEDTGIGIPPDKQERIFEAFSQGGESSTRGFDGTGLGLSITRKLVHLHGGSLSVDSSEGVGSTFSFLLPLNQEAAKVKEPPPRKVVSLDSDPFEGVAQETKPTPAAVEKQPELAPVAETPAARAPAPQPVPEPAASPTAPSGQPMLRQDQTDSEGMRPAMPRGKPVREVDKKKDQYHIMVVDDNPINIQVLVNHLQDYRISTATSGQQALDQLMPDDADFDLVLLDVMMPGMNGYEVCRKLREAYNPNELPVLLLTAKNQTKDLITGLEAGANDYITKPFAMKELMARVRTHLQLADLTRELKEAQIIALEHARSAGKAEFATSVLHNVGNILSSIKVSCTQVTMKLDQSKISGFFMATKMLEDNLADIENFLTGDPKGKRLPRYFVELAEKLRQENELINRELENMRKRIFLMEETIETQQYYAKDGGDVGPVVLENLVDESLAVQSEVLRKHRIQLDKRIEYDGTVMAHQSVLIQILVNLIKNAIEAMQGADSRVLSIHLYSDEHEVICRIADTGVGIEDLTRLFQHGFSTKADGHGFGLHYCLNAMEGMGGTLTAESEGKGQGAAFTLRFPVEP